MYPSTVDHTLDLFRCLDVNGTQYLYKDMSITCWTGFHADFVLYAAVPAFIVIVVGFPGVVLYQLYKHRKNLTDAKLFMKYKLFYQGLRHDRFYWEICIVGFKICMICINVFMGTFKTVYRVFVGCMLVTVVIILQNTLMPYKDPILNNLESRIYTTSLFMFFCGFFFVFSPSTFIENLIISSIISINVWCMSLWFYLMLRDSKNKILKNISRMFGRMNCISAKDILYGEEEQVKQMEDTQFDDSKRNSKVIS